MRIKDNWSRVRVVILSGGLALACAVGCTPKEAPKAVTPAAVKSKDKVGVSAMNPAMVLVTVNGTQLKAGEADTQIKKMLGPSMDQLTGDRLEKMMPRFRRQVVDRFVVRTLLDQEAARQNIQVNDADVTTAIDTIKTRLPQGLTLEEAMAKEGIVASEFRDNLKGELKIKKLVESQVPTNTVVSDEEVAKFYASQKDRFAVPESAEARHILIKFGDADTDATKAEKKAKAEGLRKKLLDGADFAALAKENSDCPSKEKGGNLGTFGRGQMVKPFEDAAFSQPTNAIGPVVETSFGYHIIQVLNRQDAKTSSLDEVKGRLTEYLSQKKQMESFESYLGKLKAAAKIAYDDSVKPMPAGAMPADAMMPDQE